MPDPNVEPRSKTIRQYQNAALVGIVLLIVGLSIACVQYKVPTIMTTIAPRWHLNDSTSTWLMSIFTLVGIFFALPAGKLAGRFGFKRIMIFSSGLILVGSFIGLVSGQNGAMLIASRAIEGVALTFITTCAPIAIQKCVSPERVGLATGLWGCWGNGGAVLASVLTPQIFELAGFEGVWIVFAGFAVIAAALLFFLIREPGSSLEDTVDAARVRSSDRPKYSEFLTKDIVLFLASFVMMNIIMLALLGLLPSILQLPEKGFTMQQAGFATTLASLLALISTPVFGIIADRLSRIKPPLIATYVMLGPCLFVLYTQTGIAFWIAAILLGLVGFGCVGLLIAAWMAIIPRPELVPMGMGLLTLVQSVGQFLGTFFVQMLLGPSFANWLFAGIVLMVVGLIGTAAIALTKLR